MIPSLLYGFDPTRVPDTVIQEVSPDVHYKEYFKRFGAVATFKTHHLPQPQYRRVINIVRDGRDVACSYIHFAKALGDPISLEDIIHGSSSLPFGRWQDHVTAWLQNPFDADILLVRYEDLKADTTQELRRIMQFIGVEVSEEDLHRVSAGSSVEKMKSRERSQGWDNKAWPSDKAFVRQGKSGAYQKELAHDQIERFNKAAFDALVAIGYEV